MLDDATRNHWAADADLAMSEAKASLECAYTAHSASQHSTKHSTQQSPAP